MDRFTLVGGASWSEEDVVWHARTELRDALNHLADMGWDKVTWGARDTDQAVARFAHLVHDREQARYGFVTRGAEISLKKVMYVAVTGDRHATWIEEQAPSVLEAARRCLDRARVMRRCAHPETVSRHGQMACTVCGYQRDKTAQEILSGMFSRGVGAWELTLTRIDGHPSAMTLLVDGEEAADTAKALVILKARKMGLEFEVKDEKKAVERSSLFAYETVTRKGVYRAHPAVLKAALKGVVSY